MAALTIPNPHTNPDPFDTLEFAAGSDEYVWPPQTNETTKQYGLVEWSSFKQAVNLDKKKKSGAAKQKISKTGGELISFSFTLVIVQSQAAIESVTEVLDTLRPGDGPFTFRRHPWGALVGIEAFMVESREAFPPSNGTLRVTISCTQIDADAQAGKGGNVTATPSEQSEYQRAADEWEARRNAAVNFTKAEQANRIIAERDEAQRVFDATGVRTAKKLSSVLAGDGEIDINAAQPTTPAPSNVAEGSIS